MTARPLRARLLASQLAIVLGALGVLGIVIDRVFEARALRDLRARLVAEANAATAIITDEGVRQDRVQALGRSTGARFTVIRTDGVVLADSEHDPATMENHATRPEVVAALAGRTGSNERVSDTLGTPFLYVATPVRDGIVVRAALPENQVVRERTQIRRGLGAAVAATALLASIVSLFVARTVARPLQRISEEIGQVARGERQSVAGTGPREARSLAVAINAMAEELAGRLDMLDNEKTLRDRILSTMHEAVLLVSGDAVEYANPSAASLFGATTGGRVPSALTPFALGASQADLALHHPARRDVQVRTAPTGDGRMLIVGRDVTDARRADLMRRDFVGNASHELKTPIAAMIATSETLEKAIRDDRPAAERFAATLTAEAHRLSALVQDLLDLARVEHPQTATETVDLADIVRSELQALGPAQHPIEQMLTPSLIAGRPSDLGLLVRNLLSNAIRYSERGRPITVRVDRNGTLARLLVQDQGVGIPEKDLPRVFERFFRVDHARARDTGGTGLGLAIVRHVAESHGGRVDVRSTLGEGSTFTVELPLAGD